MKGKLVAFSGPSAGVGKDTVLGMFLAKHPDWTMPVSTTTRPPRPGEIGGKDMYFVDRDGFEQLRAAGKFLESFEVNGNWYGTLSKPVEDLLKAGKNVIIRVDVQGALAIKQQLPDTILIFLNAESFEALEQRFRGRHTESEELIQERLALAKREIGFADRYDHVVINPTNHPEKAVAEIERILL